mgnify:CR=1 FL=1
MKASESNPNYPSKVREMTNYTIREIKKVCKDIGPRPSGEENERKAQDLSLIHISEPTRH